MPDTPAQIISCGESSAELVISAVRERLTSAEQVASTAVSATYPPIFVVGPEVDPGEAAQELAQYAIPDGTGVLMRTSGSTSGTGSIVALTWESLVASAAATAEALEGPGVWMSDLPLHHIAGFQTVVRSVLAGHDPLIESLKDEESVARAREGVEPDVPVYMSVVPTQLRRILASASMTSALYDVTFLVGGAASAPALLDEARGAGLRVVTSYGMTETCGGCVYDGQPIGSTRITITDGRIGISGDVVALGYVNDPAAPEFPALAADEPRVHLTKDAGEIVDGRLRVLGRIDDAITTGGLTVMPQLIEACIANCATHAVVVGIPDAEWGEATVAVVDHACDAGALRDFVKAELGAGWQPRHVITLADLGCSEWPMTQSGKVNRRELARLTRVYFERGNSK